MGRKSLGDDDSCCFLHPLSLVFTGGILISGSPWSPPPPPLPRFSIASLPSNTSCLLGKRQRANFLLLNTISVFKLSAFSSFLQ